MGSAKISKHTTPIKPKEFKSDNKGKGTSKGKIFNLATPLNS